MNNYDALVKAYEREIGMTPDLGAILSNFKFYKDEDLMTWGFILLRAARIQREAERDTQ